MNGGEDGSLKGRSIRKGPGGSWSPGVAEAGVTRLREAPARTLLPLSRHVFLHQPRIDQVYLKLIIGGKCQCEVQICQHSANLRSYLLDLLASFSILHDLSLCLYLLRPRLQPSLHKLALHGSVLLLLFHFLVLFCVQHFVRVLI